MKAVIEPTYCSECGRRLFREGLFFTYKHEDYPNCEYSGKSFLARTIELDEFEPEKDRVQGEIWPK